MSMTRIICPECKNAVVWYECDIDYEDPFNRWWELDEGIIEWAGTPSEKMTYFGNSGDIDNSNWRLDNETIYK